MRDAVAAEAVDLIQLTVEAGASPQAARKWWMTELMRQANAESLTLEELPISPAQVAEVQELIDEGIINDKMARGVIEAVVKGEGSPREIVESRGLALVSDSATLQAAVDEAIAANPDIAEKIREGKVQAVGALIGPIMKQMSGQADAAKVREMILERLSE